MAEGTLARLTVPRATVVDTQLPVTAEEDTRRLLAVMVEAEEGHRTAAEEGHRTAVLDLHTVVDMGGNTTLDSWLA
jgi:hypothetical protein